MSERAFHPVAKAEALPVGAKLAIELCGKAILLCHTAEGIFGVINRCSHAEEPLDCGRVRNGWIACPTHGARFDLATGEALFGPATEAIETFAVRVSGDMIEVEA
jgi:3-phenylpropionate/trans-cinnamate dioxygenase ferredoxin component